MAGPASRGRMGEGKNPKKDREFVLGAVSDRGSVRSMNEDYFGVFEPETEELMAKRGILIIVTDGMGGHFSGGDASRTAVEVLSDVYYESIEGEVINTLAWAFKEANRQVFERIGGGLQGLAGTTCTAVVLFPDRVHIAHVGDSRTYIVRKGEIKQLTKDHSVVGEMVRDGVLSREEARKHPRRNVITRAVGLHPSVEVDTYEDIPVEESDNVLVCSDGLFSMLQESEIASIITDNDPEKACAELVRRAKEEGGADNITAVVARKT